MFATWQAVCQYWHVPSGSHPIPGPLSQFVVKTIDARIQERGLLRKDVAAAASMSESQFSRVLSAQKVFTIDQFDAVCDALGLSMAHVIAVADVETRDRRVVPELSAPDNVVRGDFGNVGGLDQDDVEIKQPPATQRTAAKKGTRKADRAPHVD